MMEGNDKDTNAVDALAGGGRVDYRLRRSGEYTDDEGTALMDELRAYRRSHLSADRKAASWRAIAERLGIGGSTLTELRGGAYHGDKQRLWRVIDQFLADERARAGRFDVRAFASIGVARKVFGVISCCIKQNSMAAVIGEPGTGKTVAARAFAADREGAVMIRVDEASGDARGVTLALWRGLGLVGNRSHRERLAGIIRYLRGLRTAVLLIDEAQKLRADGLEVLRDVFDASDPDGRRNVPIIFFGDHGFLRLVAKARSGESGPIRPQFSRRLYPVVELVGGAGQDGGEPLYSVEDIVKILRNDRLRVVSDSGVRWLCSLANTRGFGALGFAICVARMAFELTSNAVLTPDDLRRALRLAIGPQASEVVDDSAGGQLLRAVG